MKESIFHKGYLLFIIPALLLGSIYSTNLNASFRARVKKNWVVVYAGPNKYSRAIGKIKQGRIYAVSEKTYLGFRRIRVGGKDGWVIAGVLEILPKTSPKSRFSQDSQNVDSVKVSKKERVKKRLGLENWYLFFSAGFSSVSYSGTDTATTQEMDDTASSNKAYSFDLLGVYWPYFGYKALIGGIINFVHESWTDGTIDGLASDMDVNQLLVGGSFYYFLSRYIGKGWFLRSDLGISRYSLDAKGSETRVTVVPKWGYGLLIGGGYGLPLSNETRILINLNFAYRKAGKASISTSTLSLGLLF